MIPADQEAEAVQEEGKERDKEKKGWRGERRIHSAARTGSSQVPQECGSGPCTSEENKLHTVHLEVFSATFNVCKLHSTAVTLSGSLIRNMG